MINDTIREAIEKGEKIDIEAFVEFCIEAAITNKDLADIAISSTGLGESKTSALGAAAYFLQQETMFRYTIPNVLTNLLDKGED